MLTGHGDTLAGLDPALLFAPVAQEKTIGLAVSGGADSLALMVLAAAWRSAHQSPRIIVYTLDHRLRPEAEAEVVMVARVAGSLGLECRVLRWTATKPSSGLQAAAREARYRLIGQAMRADGATVLLTGHHSHDQAETVLMRMAHGSGVAGLSGMRSMAEAFGVNLFRPLLAVGPQTLLTIVARAGLVPVSDPSNADAHYERVRWRVALSELAPLGLDDHRLAQLARRVQRIDALAEAETDRFVAAHGNIDFLGVVRLERDAVMSAQPEVAIRALTRAISAASGRPCRLLAQVESLYEGLRGGAPASLTLGGARIETRPGKVTLYREVGRMETQKVRVDAGTTFIFDGRFAIAAIVPVTIVIADLTRAQYENQFGETLDGSVAALKSAPLVTDETGKTQALGSRVFGEGVSVEGPALTDRA